MNRCCPPAVRRGSQILAAGCVLALAPVATTAASPTGHPAQRVQPRRFVQHIDVDGDGMPDRVVITFSRDLHVVEHNGRGHYTVRVTLTSTGHVVERRMQSLNYFTNLHGRWSPLFGASNLDGRAGKDLVLGFDSGASSSRFHVLRYIHGALHLMGTPPAGGPWSGNADIEESSGYRCTAHGVQTRDYGIIGEGKSRRIVIDRAWFVRRDGAWHRTKRVHEVRHGANPSPPKSDFGTFRCSGLPRGEV